MRIEANESAPAWRTFQSGDASHLLVIEGTRLYDISPQLKADLDTGVAVARSAILPIVNIEPTSSLSEISLPAPQSISLNVSSNCNLACSYCYAGRGGFDGAQRNQMGWEIARAAIDRLLEGCHREAHATIGYLGGEPFVNRKLIHRATRYAAERGELLNQDVRFSVTTNGTLLNDDDRQLIREHAFAVTVSIDGGRQVHEKQRGGQHFDALVRSVMPLLSDPGSARVSARATVTRKHFELTERFDAIKQIGFQDIGFSPVRVGPDVDVICGLDWQRCLDAYINLANRELGVLLTGGKSCFSNLVVALKQIHRGACSPYPCGAGGGYFSVSADGKWYACHRAIGNADYELGDNSGLDESLRERFLRQRHVHHQVDCRACWARYLCSGSCHQESSARNVQSCDFIRGWLEFCLEAYAKAQPEFWGSLFFGNSHVG